MYVPNSANVRRILDPIQSRRNYLESYITCVSNAAPTSIPDDCPRIVVKIQINHVRKNLSHCIG